MRWLTKLVVLADAAVVAVLVALPIGRALHLVERELGSAGVIGWLLFFIPAATSAVALARATTTGSRWTNTAVTVGFLGSFLLLPVTVYSAWSGPAAIRAVGAAVGLLFALNAVLLWRAFLTVVRDAGPGTDNRLEPERETDTAP